MKPRCRHPLMAVQRGTSDVFVLRRARIRCAVVDDGLQCFCQQRGLASQDLDRLLCDFRCGRPLEYLIVDHGQGLLACLAGELFGQLLASVLVKSCTLACPADKKHKSLHVQRVRWLVHSIELEAVCLQRHSGLKRSVSSSVGLVSRLCIGSQSSLSALMTT